MIFEFDNTYSRLPDAFFTRQGPEPVSQPEVLAWNAGLAQDLGLGAIDMAQAAQIFSGNQTPDGAAPLAQAYAGHQFGHFNPQLGDGRAILMGEIVDATGQRHDITLKGSGRTPYSRGGDGRAWLVPVLREFIVSGAMYNLGIPTTRALAAVATGDAVYRETAQPGAILTRVASSHLRVGTFEYFAARRDHENLKTLFDYAVSRHYPLASDPASFLDAVIERQIKLVTQWMGIGFIHGVMNTDNCHIAGITIDYGPCAFMDQYNPRQVYSSIDQYGRYAYGAQGNIIMWNMAQLATSLVPLMPDQDEAIAAFTAKIHAMPDDFNTQWLRVFAAKLGIANPTEQDRALIAQFLNLMEASQADFTNTFYDLGAGDAAAHFKDQSAFQSWQDTWRARIVDDTTARALMAQSNPWIIPRNHQIEAMINTALNGDMTQFERLAHALTNPYTKQNAFADLASPPTPEQEIKATFCGT